VKLKKKRRNQNRSSVVPNNIIVYVMTYIMLRYLSKRLLSIIWFQRQVAKIYINVGIYLVEMLICFGLFYFVFWGKRRRLIKHIYTQNKEKTQRMKNKLT